MEKKHSYSLATIISMIVGVVIGSGIYFRADDILNFTQGNIYLGLIVLGLGAVSITFGALSLSFLSRKCIDSGGLVAYFEKFYNRQLACGMGWFQTYVYMPTCGVVVGWAGAIYTFMLLGIDSTLWMQVLLGLFYNLFFIGINGFSRQIGGWVQKISTAIKIIPLLIIAIYGIFFAKSVVNTNLVPFKEVFFKMGWVSALVPLMFSYDGWTISLSIASEVKNPQHNVPKALIISPFIILFIYLAYVYGISNLLGSQQIIQLGDRSIFEAGKLILGQRLGNILLVIVVISVLGVCNGISMALIRMPQALAEKHMIPHQQFNVTNPKTLLSNQSILHSILMVIFWSGCHFVVMKYQVFNGRDVSEISIVFNYLSYILLYWVAYKIIKKEHHPLLRLIPILASGGSIIILIGSLIASPLYISIFIILCLSVILLGCLYYKKQQTN